MYPIPNFNVEISAWMSNHILDKAVCGYLPISVKQC